MRPGGPPCLDMTTQLLGGVHSQRHSGHCEEVGAAVHVPGAGLRVGWAVGVGKVSQTEGQA